jgi:release factor glutamine methyltransferase
MQLKKKKIIFFELEFYKSAQSFVPTGTSELLVESASKFIKQNKKILDFGCGIGVVGITLFKKNKITSNLYASDISKSSIKLSKLNAINHKVKIIAKVGNLFDPWKGEKFDIILNDVSGISQKIAKISPWFKNTSCATGNDGTALTIKIISHAKKYLNKNGVIIFPVLSLSNKKKIIRYAKSNFQNVKKIGLKTWPMPKEFNKHKSLLEKLKKNNSIDFNERFGILTFTTEIYYAK